MNLREKARQLPALPGIYLMKDSRGQILYIGKAKALNQRVISYFLPGTPQSRKNQQLIFHIADFDYQLVDTELEALLLEQKLIASYHPPYNRLMNYSENYGYLAFQDHFKLSHRPSATAVGPFAQYKKLPEVIQVLTILYHLPDKAWSSPAALALQEKRQAPLAQLSESQLQTEISAILQGGAQALTRLQLQQAFAIQEQAFEWAQRLEEDKKILLTFQKNALTLRKILQPLPQIIWDYITPQEIKVFQTFQGKIINQQKVVLQDAVDLKAVTTALEKTPLPPVEKFIPLNELDSRLIVARYFQRAFPK
ncbi:excinuclease ABC subunit C [Enterococcus sp. PF1-24]|uniref:GIY-YIG nuclease family protein n=1 Tax=unclassified Enterococcus TaxID=2608891 RepID=UPI002475A538|nr:MULTISPECIES: GIY-YIG nuclease family protein [unclassified Enterococcus]MDH6364575.1 excinuclease ABC subunit C [Enterococcus sp. PFB1-1]MDH6401676.1 excinuclease ABC subunit C [Enterococcus sp. PF1-24]